MEALVILKFITGLALLTVGAELLVRGASRLAALVGMSPLIIGLTVVAYGTSAPELAVCVDSSLTGRPEIAIGNVVGSNIANILLILGLSAVLMPLRVSRQLIILDVPILVLVTLTFFLMALDGTISRIDGLLLVAGIIAYTSWLIRIARKESKAVKEAYQEKFGSLREKSWRSVGIQFFSIIGGLAVLVWGAEWLVQSSVEFARSFGVSELIIGLTIVAVGTSLPEIATSVLATIKKNRDIVIGNVVGSNISNVLVIIGLTSIVSRNGIPVTAPALNFDFPVMLAVSVACLPIFFSGNRIGRLEGSIFLIYYVAYTLYLFLDASNHDSLEPFSEIMIEFVLPITLLSIIIITVRAIRRQSKS